ncbi:MAG: hypothetical protein ACI9SQ_000927, partial [Rubritalea sp.]
TDAVVFEVGSVGDSVKTWDGANPGGIATRSGNNYKAKVSFTGLPKHNWQFGKKIAAFTFATANSSQQPYEVFYNKNATNNPEGLNPNWFYYWKEGKVCGIPANAKYNSTIGYGRVINGVLELGPFASKNNNGPETFTGTAAYGSITVTGGGKGIACAAETAVHELRHQHYLDIASVFSADDDSDGIENKNEPSIDGVKTDSSDPDTFNLRLKSPSYAIYATYGDEEVRCRKREITHRPQLYPSKDWANPGCQSKVQYGPKP